MNNRIEEHVDAFWQKFDNGKIPEMVSMMDYLRTALTTIAEEARRELLKEIEDWQELRDATGEPTDNVQVIRKLQTLTGDKTPNNK